MKVKIKEILQACNPPKDDKGKVVGLSSLQNLLAAKELSAKINWKVCKLTRAFDIELKAYNEAYTNARKKYDEDLKALPKYEEGKEPSQEYKEMKKGMDDKFVKEITEILDEEVDILAEIIEIPPEAPEVTGQILYDLFFAVTVKESK